MAQQTEQTRPIRLRRNLAQFVGGSEEGAHMHRNFISRQPTERTDFSNAREPELVKMEKLANVSPGFDAWLQSYRKRLEEVCQGANSGSVAPSNTNI